MRSTSRLEPGLRPSVPLNRAPEPAPDCFPDHGDVAPRCRSEAVWDGRGIPETIQWQDVQTCGKPFHPWMSCDSGRTGDSSLARRRRSGLASRSTPWSGMTWWEGAYSPCGAQWPSGALGFDSSSSRMLRDPGRARIVQSRPPGRPGTKGPPAPQTVSGRIRPMQAGFAARVGDPRGR